MKWFVIGNGPSLTAGQLDAISGYPSVALNRIHLMYPKTDWRPTIYCKTDHNPRLADVYNEENILNTKECLDKAYLWEWFMVAMGEHPKVTWVDRCAHHYYHADNIKRVQSWHLPTICTAFSGIGPAMQIAVLNGATEIYLLGCDIGYGRGVGKDHFSPEYSLNKKNLSKWDDSEVTEAHIVARRSSPVPIYNCSTMTVLDVHEKVNLWDALGL